MKKRLLITILIVLLCATAGYIRYEPAKKLDTASTFVAIVYQGVVSGSGVYLGNGVIVTAEHIAEYAGSTVQTEDGRIFDILDTIVPSEDQDIAFVLIDPNCGLTPVVLGGMPSVLDPVVTVGTPKYLIFLNNVTTGVVSKMNVDWYRWDRGIMTSAPMQPGNSGGALLNSKFELIGITVGCFNRYRDCGIICGCLNP
jgi:S1-C subfamily serine protease